MTVSADTNKISYIGNGTATEFAVPFPFLDAAHLKVYQLLNNVQSERTDWTIQDGNVVFASAPASEAQIVILREVPFTQETDYRENEILAAETLERNVDKLTMICQQIKEKVDRSVGVSLFSNANPSEIIDEIETLYVIKDEIIAAAKRAQDIKNCSDNIVAIVDAPGQAVSAAIAAGNAEKSAIDSAISANSAATSAINAEDAATAAAQSAYEVAHKSNVDLSNVTSIGKEKAIGWGKPNYAAGISISSGTVIPDNGVIVGVHNFSDGGYRSITINGVTLFNTRTGGSYLNSQSAGHQYSVSKGDTVIYVNYSSMIFYPCKGA